MKLLEITAGLGSAAEGVSAADDARPPCAGRCRLCGAELKLYGAAECCRRRVVPSRSARALRAVQATLQAALESMAAADNDVAAGTVRLSSLARPMHEQGECACVAPPARNLLAHKRRSFSVVMSFGTITLISTDQRQISTTLLPEDVRPRPSRPSLAARHLRAWPSRHAPLDALLAGRLHARSSSPGAAAATPAATPGGPRASPQSCARHCRGSRCMTHTTASYPTRR